MGELDELIPGPEHYKLVARIGRAKEGSVYKAEYLPTNILVAIKICDPHKIDPEENDITTLLRRITSDQNYVHLLCRFVHQDYIWLVMDYMDRGSLKSLIQAYFPNGLSEQYIACILYQTLESFKSDQNHVFLCQNFSVGHIYIDSSGGVKVLCDILHYEDDLKKKSSGLVVSHWAVAPEIDPDGDNWHTHTIVMWMFGVAALHLAFGTTLPVSSARDWKHLLNKIIARYGPNNKRKRRSIKIIPRLLMKYSRMPIPKHGKKLSRSFWEMVALCFQVLWTRPKANILIRHKFFKINSLRFNDPREPFAQEVLRLECQGLQHDEEVIDEWIFYGGLPRSSSFLSTESLSSSSG